MESPLATPLAVFFQPPALSTTWMHLVAFDLRYVSVRRTSVLALKREWSCTLRCRQVRHPSLDLNREEFVRRAELVLVAPLGGLIRTSHPSSNGGLENPSGYPLPNA